MHCLVWGHGKLTWITKSHCTWVALHVSSWRGLFTAEWRQLCQSALNEGDWALGGRSWCREYIETSCILGEHGAMRVWHLLPLCWHGWAFYIGCGPTRGVATQERHNLKFRSSDTHTKNRHVARNVVHRYTQGNVQDMVLMAVCNAWYSHLHREHCNTCSQHWEITYRWEATVPAWVPGLAPRRLFPTAYLPTSDEYCGFWSNLGRKWPLLHCTLMVSGESSMIDCQFSYILATIACR